MGNIHKYTNSSNCGARMKKYVPFDREEEGENDGVGLRETYTKFATQVKIFSGAIFFDRVLV